MSKTEESKRDCIRRVCKANKSETWSNVAICELVKKETGRDVRPSDVIGSLGRTSYRARADRPAAFKAIQGVFDACYGDLRLVRFYLQEFVSKWEKAKRNPEVKP